MAKGLDAKLDDDRDEAAVDRMIDEIGPHEKTLFVLNGELKRASHELNRLNENVAELEEEVAFLRNNIQGLIQAAAIEKNEQLQLAVERDILRQKLADVLAVSATEMQKIVDHTERTQHFRFLPSKINELEAELGLAHESEQRLKEAVCRLQDMLSSIKAASYLELQALQANGKEMRSALSSATNANAVRSRENDKLKVQFAEAEAKFNDLVVELNSTKFELLKLQQVESNSSENLAAIVNSNSWKFTMPLRQFGRGWIRIRRYFS